MRRIVIEERVTQWKVACFAADHGLIFYDEIAEGDANPEEVIWASGDATTRLQRLKDRFSGITYLVVDGADEASLTVGAIEELDGLSLATLLDAVAVDPKAARDLPVIAALGVLAPPSFDPRVFDEFSRLLADEEPAIRARTISAMPIALAGVRAAAGSDGQRRSARRGALSGLRRTGRVSSAPLRSDVTHPGLGTLLCLLPS